MTESILSHLDYDIPSNLPTIGHDNLELPKLVEQINRACIDYAEDWKYKILTSYMLIPSSFCKVLPHLVLQGVSGTGKSAPAKIISKMYGVEKYPLYSSSTTATAFRNYIEKARYNSNLNENGLIEREERNTFLLIDDINVKTLTDSSLLFPMLKCSYSRTSDIISISAGNGENYDFRTFCPKVMSSICRFWELEQFNELKRRILVLTHKPSYENLLDIDYYDIDELSYIQFEQFWQRKKGDFLYIRKHNIKSIPAKLIKSPELKLIGKLWIDLYSVYQLIYPDEDTDIKQFLQLYVEQLNRNNSAISLEDYLKQNLSSIRQPYDTAMILALISSNNGSKVSAQKLVDNFDTINMKRVNELIRSGVRDKLISPVSNEDVSTALHKVGAHLNPELSSWIIGKD